LLRLPSRDDRLSEAEWFALLLLTDLARLIPADDVLEDAVRLTVVDGDERAGHLRACVAHDWFLEPGDGVVRVPRGALATVVDVAGAAVEQRSTDRDRHGRVPSLANPLVEAGLERDPVISIAGATLRKTVLAAAGRRPVRLAAPWPNGKRWAAAVTHDLDVVDHWGVFTVLRLQELARRGRLGLAARVLGAAVAAVGRDPVGRAARNLLAGEADRGIASTWFVLCGSPTVATMRAGDLTYRPEGRRASAIVTDVAHGGHEIGLHGSFETLERPERFVEQRARLEHIVGKPVSGVRQHYVRMNPGRTQRGIADAGFAYDATYGFPDRNGFRLGVADVVPGWDVAAEQTTDLDEVPLMWMDRAQSKYQGIEDPTAWVNDGRTLAEACRSVEGAWVGVWHPNMAPALGFPGAPAAYDVLLDALLAEDPFVSTLTVLTAWRRSRRSLRAAGLRTDGRLDVRVEERPAHPVQIEDAEGRVVQTVEPSEERRPS
jgi:hypothetical protein